MSQTHPRLFIKGNSQNLSYRYTFEWHIIKNQLQKFVPSIQDSDIGKILFESENLNLKMSFLRSNFSKNSRQNGHHATSRFTILSHSSWHKIEEICDTIIFSSPRAPLSPNIQIWCWEGSFFSYRSRLIFLHLIQEHQLQSKQQINTRTIWAILHLKITPMYIHLNVDKTQHWSSFPRSARASHAYPGDA